MSGGQFSLFRVLFGVYLLVHFAQLVPYGAELFSNEGVLPDGSASVFLGLFPNVLALVDGPDAVTTLLVSACVASVLFALGIQDRIMAVLLWYLWACLFGRNPLISNPSLPYVGLLLLVCAGMPSAPYGSWAARGRADPAGGWRAPVPLLRVVWILLALGYSYSGWTKLASPSWRDGTAVARVLDNPLTRPDGLGPLLAELPEPVLRGLTWAALGLELGFALFALLRVLRPVVWGAMLAMHLGLIAVVDFADLSLAMVLVHLFTFDRRWVRPRFDLEPSVVFFDGSCGLCHRSVRLLLAEDPDPDGTYRYAPLQGETLARAVPDAGVRDALPDSIVVRRADGRLLVRSSAVVHLLRGLGGMWGVFGVLLWVVPKPLRDLGYGALALVRRRLFPQPKELCPLLPARLQAWFLP